MEDTSASEHPSASFSRAVILSRSTSTRRMGGMHSLVWIKTGGAGESTFKIIHRRPNSHISLTRLIIRHRDLPALDATLQTVNAIFESISFFMEQRMLRGIRDHAEKLNSALAEP
jgi:hypothetical protein